MGQGLNANIQNAMKFRPGSIANRHQIVRCPVRLSTFAIGTRRTKRKTPSIIKTTGNVINDLTSQEVASCTGTSTRKNRQYGSEGQSYPNREPQPTFPITAAGTCRNSLRPWRHRELASSTRLNLYGFFPRFAESRSFSKAHRNVEIMGSDWRVWKFVLLQRLPHTGKYVGFVVYVEPQNTTIFSDCHNE